MTLKSKTTRYSVILLLGIGLIALYYLNNTYVVNFFNNDFPLLVRRFKSREIYLLDRPDPANVINSIRAWSVVIYFFAICLLHVFLIRVIFSARVSLLFILIIGTVSALSVSFFVLLKFFPESYNLYYLSRVLKDFLLSPVLPAMFIILRLFLPTDITR